MKQTAVEWLVDQLIEQGYFNKDIPKTFTNLDHLTHQAKAMEKEQIIDAYNNGQQIPPFEYAEQYYNETFKSE